MTSNKDDWALPPIPEGEPALTESQERAIADTNASFAAYNAAHSRRETIWLDDWDYGAWCDTCLLPSGSAVTMTHITSDWVDVPYRSFACIDCGTKTRTTL